MLQNALENYNRTILGSPKNPDLKEPWSDNYKSE